jgi:hypothetical protein
MPFDTPEARSVEMIMMMSSLSSFPGRAIRIILPLGDCPPEPLKGEGLESLAIESLRKLDGGEGVACGIWNVKFGSQGFYVDS